MKSLAHQISQRMLTPGMRNWINLQRRKHRLQWPRAGALDFGDFERLAPVSTSFGFDRGTAIDRHYIETFLTARAGDIRGRVLELGDDTYIRRFGGGQVTQADVLHVVAGNPEATIVADLTDADHIPSDIFDCIIFTQSIQMIYDWKAALTTLHRILKPGGVVLITSAGIAKIGRRLGRDDWGEYWHFTAQSMQAALDETFPGGTLDVGSYGNVFAACCALQGVAAEELLDEHLSHTDPDFEVLVTARAQKAAR